MVGLDWARAINNAPLLAVSGLTLSDADTMMLTAAGAHRTIFRLDLQCIERRTLRSEWLVTSGGRVSLWAMEGLSVRFWELRCHCVENENERVYTVRLVSTLEPSRYRPLVRSIAASLRLQQILGTPLLALF